MVIFALILSKRNRVIFISYYTFFFLYICLWTVNFYVFTLIILRDAYMDICRSFKFVASIFIRYTVSIHCINTYNFVDTYCTYSTLHILCNHYPNMPHIQLTCILDILYIQYTLLFPSVCTIYVSKI